MLGVVGESNLQLNKSEFFDYDLVEISQTAITLLKNEVTEVRIFVIRPNTYELALEFLTQAEAEGWISKIKTIIDINDVPIGIRYRINKFLKDGR